MYTHIPEERDHCLYCKTMQLPILAFRDQDEKIEKILRLEVMTTCRTLILLVAYLANI